MRPNGRQARSWQAALLALLFIACALSGLAAGFTTRAVAGGALTAVGTRAPGHTGSSGPTHTPAQSSPSATTPPATIVAPSGFSVTAVVTPRSVAAGQPFTVTATVVAPDGVTPLAGVACSMGAAPGSAPLFTTWPPPAVSDSTGHATWSLTVPTTATPGSYVLDISARGAGDWQTDWQPSVTITS